MRYQKVPTWPQKVASLPRVLDRFRAACVFFDVRYPSFLIDNIDARKWTSWAALSAIASIPEVVEYDFEELSLLSAWKNSPELGAILSNKTFAVLKELRNYEMHIEYQPRVSHMDADRTSLRESIDHNSFFFMPISWQEFSKLRNISSGRSIVDQSALQAFNEYAKQYSVETIVDHMLEWLADQISPFIQRHT